MSDYAQRHPTDVIEQLRIRYKAIALVADVMREIEEYRIEHGVDAKITPALHVAEIDIPPEVLAAIHEFNYQLLDAERSIEAWLQKHGAVLSVPANTAEHAKPATNRAVEGMESERDSEGNHAADGYTHKRGPDALYWRAYTEMRAAYARLHSFEQQDGDAPSENEDIEWACAESLAKLGPIMQEVQDAKGMCTIAIEHALELAGALLLGMRALTLVLRTPSADWRGEIRTEDVDFPADGAIGWLLSLLDELAADGTAERWMREDARGLLRSGICGAKDDSA